MQTVSLYELVSMCGGVSAVLPCVINGAWMHRLVKTTNDPYSLLGKLSAALHLRSSSKVLEVETFLDCLRCASTKDGICLVGHLMSSQ